jgi:hypothetical protein
LGNWFALLAGDASEAGWLLRPWRFPHATATAALAVPAATVRSDRRVSPRLLWVRDPCALILLLPSPLDGIAAFPACQLRIYYLLRCHEEVPG